MAPSFLIFSSLADMLCRSYSAAPISGGTGTSTGTGPSTSCTAVAVTFNELVTTTYGETVEVTGNVSQLGNWDTDDAIALSATSYTSSNPLWFGVVYFPPGTTFEYKLIKLESDGTVTWESGNNKGMIPNLLESSENYPSKG